MLALLVAFSACASGTPDAQTSTTSSGDVGSTGRLEQTLDDVLGPLDDQDFSGLVMVKEGDELDVRGFGFANRDEGSEWDQHTVFDIGSITKQFTGAAIVRLEMDGRLSVDDTLGDHVPYATGELAEVTLHELLTHTAGLPGGLGDDYDPVSRTEIVELSASAIENRGQHNYSNPGYSMLGVVIEEVTGMSYEEYLREVFFAPLGMTDTGYVLPDWSTDTVAVGYDGPDALEQPNELPWDVDGPYWHLRANGGVLSTGVDMMKWHEALLGNDVLDDAAKAKLFERHSPEGAVGGPSYYAYGWVNFELGNGNTLITHNGGNGIFFADFLRFVDDDLTILVATNVAGADEDVAYRVGDALLGTALAAPSEAGEGCVPDAVDGLEVLPDFPESDAGVAVRAMLGAVTDFDDAERQAFSASHLPEYLVQGMNDAQVSAELALIQEEFSPFVYQDLRQSDGVTFHLVFAGSVETEGDAVVTVAVNPDDPTEIACFDLGFGY